MVLPVLAVASSPAVSELPSNVAVAPSLPIVPPAVTDDPSSVADAEPDANVALAVASEPVMVAPSPSTQPEMGPTLPQILR